MGQIAMSDKVLTAFANAYPFMEVAGDVVMAWMLLWRPDIAAAKLAENANAKDAAFYKGQIKAMDYFVNSVLPTTQGKMRAILGASDAVATIEDASFSS
jgi:hypothetical protein